MHQIPQEFLWPSMLADPLDEKMLLTWLPENKVEELDCSNLHIIVFPLNLRLPPYAS